MRGWPREGLKFLRGRRDVIFSPLGIYAAVVAWHGGRNCGVGWFGRGLGGEVAGCQPLSATPGGLVVDYKRSFCCVVSRCLTLV